MYLSYIDGIRALAIISVFVYHLNPQLLPGGFSGVDVFFVVSGYVVSLSLDKQRGVSLRAFLAVFYSRRVKRILPALVFCLLISIFFINLFLPESAISHPNKKTALYAFFGLSNIILATKNNDYFGPTAEFNAFTHTWSLGVEEQFYLLFPFIFILWTSGKKSYYKKLSVIILITLFSASLGMAYWYSNTNKLYEYYLIFSRFWQLAAGILLYQFVKSSYETKLKPFRKLLVSLSWCALGFILAGFVVSDAHHFPIPWAFPGVLGTVLLLLSMHYLKSGLIRALLENKVLSIIGKMSYSLYLWHWPVIVLFRWTIGIDTPLKYFAVLAITFAMSGISYLFIEMPIRTNPFIAKSPRFAVIAVGIFVIFASNGIGKTLFHYKESYTINAARNEQDWYTGVYENDEDKSLRPLTEYGEGFYGGVKLMFSPENPLNDQTVFVLGDSHANAYMTMITKLSSETGRNSIIYTMPGCGDTINKTFSEMPLHCQDFLNKSLEDVFTQSNPGDILFLASLKLPRFTEQWENSDVEKAFRTLSSETAQAARFFAIDENLIKIRPLTEKGIRVIYEAPKPIFKSPPFRCTEWFNAGNPVCAEGLTINKEELLNYRQPVMDSLYSITSGLENAYVYDPLDILCPDDTCNSMVDDRPLFFDGDHLSAYGNIILYDSFNDFLSEIERNPLVISEKTTANFHN